MKSLLIAATALGAVIAGLILYNRNSNSTQGQIEGAAKDAYKTMNEGIGRVERLGQHSMG